MVVFNPHSNDFVNMSSSQSSPSSLLGRLPQKHKHRQEQTNLNKADLSFDCDGDDDDVLGFKHSETTLEYQARAFFNLARVADRRESRYNSHGNRVSFHGQKNKLYKNVFSGSEAIDSMVASGLAPSREKALSLGNRLSLELSLFLRANRNTSSGRHAKPKGRAGANLLAAQTILLGSSDTSKGDPTGNFTTAVDDDTTSVTFEGCFTDDINAFYRFGPGVLAILRGIDDDYARLLSSSQRERASGSTTSTEESSFDSNESNYQTKKKHIKNKDEYDHVINDEKLRRNLSITPNVPGCNGNIVLEDLFALRHPETETTAKGNANTAVAASSTNAVQGKSKNKAYKKSNKKSNKKSASMPHQPSVPAPSPLPKSILKNGKVATSKVTHKKSKGSHRKTTHKFKAGAKIKYVSQKERRIASIEKRLSTSHCDHQISLYRQMLKELENRLSRLYTGDHVEIISLSSHLSSPPSPNKHHGICASVGCTVSADEQSLVNDYVDATVDIVGEDSDFERNGGLDSALESLDDIISSNADLLANGDDNASVWTEFIMGTSQEFAQANKITDLYESDNPKCMKSEPKTNSVKAKKKETTLFSTTRNVSGHSKDNPYSVRHLPKVVENEVPETKDDIIEHSHHQQQQQQQQQQKKNVEPPTGWRAPPPLESGSGNGSSKNRNKAYCDGNEIDLSSWAMINRDREAESNDIEDRINNSWFPRQMFPQPSKFGGVICHGTQSSNPSSKDNGDSVFLSDGAREDFSFLAPDDVSLLLEQQQEKEFQSFQIYDRGNGCDSKGQGYKENDSCHIEQPKNTSTGPISKSSGTFDSTSSSVGSFRSNTTKDSNDLAKLRLLPRRQKNDNANNNRPSRPGKEWIIDEGNEARYRGYSFKETRGARAGESALESPTPPASTNVNCDASIASDATNSGIMEAIEQDPFYQQAVELNDSKHTSSTTEKNSDERKNGSDFSPVQSEPGSFTASYNGSNFHDSFDDFDGEEASVDTYSDDGSYMELTVRDEETFEEIEEEVFEELVIEEGEELYEEITVISQPNSQCQSPYTIGSRPALSPRRKSAQFRSAMYLPSVPELGPEPEPEPEPQPTSPQREKSVYVEVHSMTDDDEMTQITMDCFHSSSYRSNRSLHIIPEDDYSINNGDYSNHNSYLFPLKEGKEVKSEGSSMASPIRNRNSRKMKKSSQLVSSTPITRQKNQFFAQHHLKQRTKYMASSTSCSALGHPCNTVLPTETSQQRIQEILWKDLPSSDATVTWSALEELRIIVANESRSRAYLVRHGGVMIIIDTMAEQLEVEVIQFLCCNILEKLSSMDFDICLTILELGGVALIEQSMKKHAGSHRVKQMGDAALRTLLYNS